ncbi:hypothetical protein [Streptomyces sp. NPDC053069]|uniref:hypothetical protein n=1 Tax=Streptomyces sp. NPDC053069 TaxID=3365695 RepID=UPI0037D0C75D
MAVDRLPGGVREFASYLDGLLARLDQGGGWSGVFWQRDPDGMRACLDGSEVPPWDVVEALLEDLAAAYGRAAAVAERERARALHRAALAAYDAHPGARDTLLDRLDVMLREQRYAAERQAELSRLLSTPSSAEEADSLRLDLAWAHDDHARATARCTELRGRLAELDRQEPRNAHAVRRPTDSAPPRTEPTHRGTPTTRNPPAEPPARTPNPDGDAVWHGRGAEGDAARRGRGADGDAAWDGRGAEGDAVWRGGRAEADAVWGGRGAEGDAAWGGQGAEGDAAWRGRGADGGAAWGGQGAEGDAAWRGREAEGDAARRPSESASVELPARSTVGSEPRPDGPVSGTAGRVAASAFGEDPRRTGSATSPPAPAQPSPLADAAASDPRSDGSVGAPYGPVAAPGSAVRPSVPAPPSLPAPDAAAAAVRTSYAAASSAAAAPPRAAQPFPAVGGSVRGPYVAVSDSDPQAAVPSPAVPGGSAPEAVPPPPPAKPRKRRRGSARFAGVVEDGDAPGVVQQVPLPVMPEAPVRRVPRGARFAGGAEGVEAEGAGGEVVDVEAGAAVAGVVEGLARLRAEGRSGEAHVLLTEAAQWPAGRFPALADALARAGLGADWATLLWEAASLPAERLVAVADALTAAGRDEDARQLLRQGVARPPEQIGAAVLRLAEAGRRWEAEALLDACVRVRTAEEAARSAAPDPRRIVPLLLRSAQAVSDERHWDLVHALRVAGYTM